MPDLQMEDLHGEQDRRCGAGGIALLAGFAWTRRDWGGCRTLRMRWLAPGSRGMLGMAPSPPGLSILASGVGGGIARLYSHRVCRPRGCRVTRSICTYFLPWDCKLGLSALAAMLLIHALGLAVTWLTEPGGHDLYPSMESYTEYNVCPPPVSTTNTTAAGQRRGGRGGGPRGPGGPSWPRARPLRGCVSFPP
jgi:hypothetical protein